MKIKTEKINKFSNLVKMACHGDSEETDSGQINLDFKNSVLRVFNEDFMMEMEFEHDVDTSTVNNFCINSREFLALCDRYEEIEVDENQNFKVEDKIYKLYSSSDDLEAIDFDKNNSSKIEMNPDIINKLKDGLKFIEEDNSIRNFNGVRFYDNKIVSLNGVSLYEAEISSDDKKIDFDADFNKNIIQVLESIPSDGISTYFNQESKSILLEDENQEVKILFFIYEDLDIPEKLDTEKVINTYSHDKEIVIEKNLFLNEIGFLMNFVYSVVNNRIYLKIEDDKKIMCTSAVDDDAGEIYLNHTIDIIKVNPNLISLGFWVGLQHIYDAVSVIDDSEIMIQIDLTKKITAYNIIGNSNKEKHVAISMLE